jgi:NADH:ubiquinone oxidoreductase subunit C
MWPSARYFEYDAFSLFGIDVQYSCDVGGID